MPIKTFTDVHSFEAEAAGPPRRDQRNYLGQRKESRGSHVPLNGAEGKITRLKLVRRQMYGRGNIDLLQARLMGPQ